MPGYGERIVEPGHICRPPRGQRDDQRWRCPDCKKRYWYNAAKRRWELLT